MVEFVADRGRGGREVGNTAGGAAGYLMYVFRLLRMSTTYGNCHHFTKKSTNISKYTISNISNISS